MRAYGTDPQIWGGDNTCEHVFNESSRTLQKGTVSEKQSTHSGNDGSGFQVKYGFCTKCSAWRGELGSEPTPELFIEHLMLVYDACWRVLRNDGIFWVNIADSYAGSGKGPTGKGGLQNAEKRQNFTDPGAYRGLKPQSMCMVPERMLLAMAERGWILRSKIRLAKTSAMPESVRNRPSNATEELYMFTKISSGYFYDQDAVRQEHARMWTTNNGGSLMGDTDWQENAQSRVRGNSDRSPNPAGANMKNWWYWTPEPATYEFCTNCDGFYNGIALRSLRSKKFPGSSENPCVCGKEEEHKAKVCPNCQSHAHWHNHYAVFPTWLPERCIKVATSVHGACARCGAPWERVKSEDTGGLKGQSWVDHSKDGEQGRHRSTTSKKIYDTYKRGETLSWQPTCKCDCEEVVPCKVLDCFSGSGTTALVADRLGRHGIGIELNFSYYNLSISRIKSDAPLVAAVEEQERFVQKGLFDV